MANQGLTKGIVPIIIASTVIVGGYALIVRLFAYGSRAAKASYEGGQYLLSVRYPGQWYDVRDFVQPNVREVIAVYSQIGPDPWECLDFVCRNISYRRELGEFWLFPGETLDRREGDCEDTSLLLCSLLRNFTNAYVVLGEYGGYAHAWCQLDNQILETTYNMASPVPDPQDYCPHFIFNEREAIELWPGALNQVLQLRREEVSKLRVMARALK